jgi:hypothetical protein
VNPEDRNSCLRHVAWVIVLVSLILFYPVYALVRHLNG